MIVVITYQRSAQWLWCALNSIDSNQDSEGQGAQEGHTCEERCMTSNGASGGGTCQPRSRLGSMLGGTMRAMAVTRVNVDRRLLPDVKWR